MSVASALTCLASCLLSVVAVAAVSPWVLLFLLPLGVLYYRVQRLYIATSRELKRLDAVAFSPIFSHYGESLAGLATIRAFGRSAHFAAVNRVGAFLGFGVLVFFVFCVSWRRLLFYHSLRTRCGDEQRRPSRLPTRKRPSKPP